MQAKRQRPKAEAKLEETKRITRILDIVQLIYSSPGQWTRKALAEKYELSERQIQRDFDIIRHGLLLELERPGQKYRFAEVPRLPVVSYSLSEALALILAVQSASEYGVESSELASAMGRLESVFPKEFRKYLRSISAGSRSGTATGQQAVLMALGRAIATSRKVQLEYSSRTSQDGSGARTVRPYTMLPRNRSWYTVGFCETRQAVRMFKVSRISSITLLDETFTIPVGFDLERQSGGAWGLVWGTGPVERVVLRFAPIASQWASEEEWHPSQRVEWEADGRCTVSLDVSIAEDFVRRLMWYGAEVEVVAPESLRERLRQEHQAAAAVAEPAG